VRQRKGRLVDMTKLIKYGEKHSNYSLKKERGEKSYDRPKNDHENTKKTSHASFISTTHIAGFWGKSRGSKSTQNYRNRMGLKIQKKENNMEWGAVTTGGKERTLLKAKGGTFFVWRNETIFGTATPENDAYAKYGYSSPKGRKRAGKKKKKRRSPGVK